MRALVVVTAVLFASPALAAPPGLDQLAGQHFEIRAEDLPPPPTERIPYVANAPQRVERGDAMPIVPEGFSVTLFAEGLPHPRRIAVLGDGSVLAVNQGSGQIIGLIDDDGDGVADRGGVWAQNLNQPFGIAVLPTGSRKGDLLLSDPATLYALPVTGGTMLEISLPGAFGDPEEHITRPIAIHPTTGKIFVGVGSMGNLAEEPEVKATIQRFAADGTNQTTFARGLRNATGLAFEPTTGDI